MTAEAVERLLGETFPQLFAGVPDYRIESVGAMSARMRLTAADRHLRPGGTVSGPTLFTLADLCLYVAILAQVGPLTQTVTTSMTMNFMRRPPPGDLVADGTLLKLGRRLAVGEVRIAVPGSTALIAHATGTYAIPDQATVLRYRI